MNKPKLILVGGAPATGKTTVATALAKATGIRRVSMDEVKEALFDVGGYRDRAWSKEIGRIAWPTFQRLVELHLAKGDSLIAEATYVWPSDVRWIRSLMKKYHPDATQLWLTADPSVARERFLKRANSRKRHPGHNDALDAVLAEFDKRYFHRRFEKLSLGKVPTLVIDTSASARLDIKEISQFVSRS